METCDACSPASEVDVDEDAAVVAGPAVGGVVDGGGMNAARDGGRREDEVKLPRGRRGGLTRAVVAGHAGAVRWQLIRPGIGLAAAVGVLRPDEGEAERLSAVEDALVAVAVVGVAVLTTPGQTIDLTPICWSSDGDRVSAACGGGRSASRRRVGKMACITRSSSGHTRLQDLWHARETNWPLMYCRDWAWPEPWTVQHNRTRWTTPRHAFPMFPKPGVAGSIPAGGARSSCI